jgi:hypothetical protein
MKRFIIGTVAGLALAGGIAYATIPDGNGVVHGCYGNISGQLRVIDPSAGGACKSSETSLDWNQQGVQGAQGLPGAAATNLWAVVRQDGTLIRGKGVVSSSGSFLFPGVYYVKFDQNISHCALSATLGSDDVAPAGEISALIASSGTNPDTALVFTRTAQDDIAGLGGHTAKPFFLETFC